MRDVEDASVYGNAAFPEGWKYGRKAVAGGPSAACDNGKRDYEPEAPVSENEVWKGPKPGSMLISRRDAS
jgi:hypothetical protein